MKKYVLIVASKDSYDRCIEIDSIQIFETIQLASEEIKKWIWQSDILNKIDSIIKLKDTYVEDEDGDTHFFHYNEDGILTFYSTGCPSTNEYCGHTCEIMEID